MTLKNHTFSDIDAGSFDSDDLHNLKTDGGYQPCKSGSTGAIRDTVKSSRRPLHS